MINTRKQLNFSSLISTQVILFSLCQLMRISQQYFIAIVLLLSFMYGGCGNFGGKRNSTDSKKSSSYIVSGDMGNRYFSQGTHLSTEDVYDSENSRRPDGDSHQGQAPLGDSHIPSLQTMSSSTNDPPPTYKSEISRRTDGHHHQEPSQQANSFQTVSI